MRRGNGVQNHTFDDNHFNRANKDVKKLPECPQHALLEYDITESEFDTAIRNSTKGSSMDNDEFHPRMFEHLDPKFKSLLLELYNTAEIESDLDESKDIVHQKTEQKILPTLL